MAEKTWVLHDSFPVSMAQGFDAVPSAAPAVYWGPFLVAFNAAETSSNTGTAASVAGGARAAGQGYRTPTVLSDTFDGAIAPALWTETEGGSSTVATAGGALVLTHVASDGQQILALESVEVFDLRHPSAEHTFIFTADTDSVGASDFRVGFYSVDPDAGQSEASFYYFDADSAFYLSLVDRDGQEPVGVGGLSDSPFGSGLRIFSMTVAYTGPGYIKVELKQRDPTNPAVWISLYVYEVAAAHLVDLRKSKVRIAYVKSTASSAGTARVGQWNVAVPTSSVGTAASTMAGAAHATTATQNLTGTGAATAKGAAEAATATQSQQGTVASAAPGPTEAATGTQSQTGTAATTEGAGAEAATGQQQQTGVAESVAGPGAEAASGASPDNVGTAGSSAAPGTAAGIASQESTGTLASSMQAGFAATLAEQQQEAEAAATAAAAAQAADAVQVQSGTAQTTEGGPGADASGGMTMFAAVESVAGPAAEFAGEPPPNIGTAESAITAEQSAVAFQAMYGEAASTAAAPEAVGGEPPEPEPEPELPPAPFGGGAFLVNGRVWTGARHADKPIMWGSAESTMGAARIRILATQTAPPAAEPAPGLDDDELIELLIAEGYFDGVFA